MSLIRVRTLGVARFCSFQFIITWRSNGSAGSGLGFRGCVLNKRDFLSRQTVQVIHQPVNLRVRRVNLALENGLLRGRLRDGKLPM